jgi:hypothetical protein
VQGDKQPPLELNPAPTAPAAAGPQLFLPFRIV